MGLTGLQAQKPKLFASVHYAPQERWTSELHIRGGRSLESGNELRNGSNHPSPERMTVPIV
jgi:hypothetical protein